MEPLDLKSVETWVNENIAGFHRRKLRSIENLKLSTLLKKNPYLFKAKNIVKAGDLVDGFLEAFLSSSEEKLFGDFLEDLAIFVAQQTAGGHKSAASGVDLEFFNDGFHYVVSVKSGTNWGNSSQHSKLAQDLSNAVLRVRQSNQAANVRSVLGICYGKTKTAYHKSGYMKVVGQNFWHLISENKNLYTDIIEPIGYEAKAHNDKFTAQKGQAANLLTSQFIALYCNKSGAIDWQKLVKSVCGNYDLGKFLSSPALK